MQYSKQRQTGHVSHRSEPLRYAPDPFGDDEPNVQAPAKPKRVIPSRVNTGLQDYLIRGVSRSTIDALKVKAKTTSHSLNNYILWLLDSVTNDTPHE